MNNPELILPAFELTSPALTNPEDVDKVVPGLVSGSLDYRLRRLPGKHHHIKPDDADSEDKNIQARRELMQQYGLNEQDMVEIRKLGTKPRTGVWTEPLD